MASKKNAATQLSKSAELSSYVPSANYLNVDQTGGHNGADKGDKTLPQKESLTDMKRATFASKFWKLSAGGSSSSEYVNNQGFRTFEEKWETKAEILESNGSELLMLDKTRVEIHQGLLSFQYSVENRKEMVGPRSWLVSDHYPQAGGAMVQQHQTGFVATNNSVVSSIIYPTTNPPPLTTDDQAAVTNGIDLDAFHLSFDELDRSNFSVDELFLFPEQKPKPTSLAPAP